MEARYTFQEAPISGFWEGKVVQRPVDEGSSKGIGILCEGQEVFVRSKTEVAKWLVK